jgi:glutamyl-tRNA reductase
VRLRLIHQPPGATPVPPGAVLWRTCLREVAFLAEETDGPNDRGQANAPVVADEEAYALLLEIVCGLRSPLVGETEVQAQFKAFLASLDRRHDAPLLRLGQRVLADAKVIRQRHLQGLGAHSYGPLVGRHVPEGRRVILVGTGALAAEVAHSLTGHTIDRWGRRVVDDHHVYHLISAAGDRPVESADPATLVIAAPASQSDLLAVAACYSQLREIIDLRAAGERSAFAGDAHVVTLDDLFVEARDASTVSMSRLSAARRDVSDLGQTYARREELHPFGWDDLCA